MVIYVLYTYKIVPNMLPDAPALWCGTRKKFRVSKQVKQNSFYEMMTHCKKLLLLLLLFYYQTNIIKVSLSKKNFKNTVELTLQTKNCKVTNKRNEHKQKWKSDQRRKHCALAVVRRSQKFSPRCRPLPGGAGRPKFKQLEMVTTCTYRPSLVKIDARIFELSW